MLSEKAHSLRRAVSFGLENGKRNVIADLDVLDELFREIQRLEKAKLDEWRKANDPHRT